MTHTAWKIPVLKRSIQPGYCIHLGFKIFELIKRLILNGNELRLIISLENLPISEYYLAVIVLIIYDSMVENRLHKGRLSYKSHKTDIDRDKESIKLVLWYLSEFF